MKIGILGSGLMGGKLGTLFARAGHDVVFSYARSREKLNRLARDAGVNAHAGTPTEAARDADAVLLAVPWARVEDALTQAGDLSGKVLLSCCIPHEEGASDLSIGHTWSGAEEVAKRANGARVVSAFHTAPSEVFFPVFERRGETGRPSLLYSGDDPGANDVAANLIRDVGFDPVYAGPLRTARYTEPFVMVIARLAYEVGGDPELAYRFMRIHGRLERSG
jgi:predicted dinucleotide-binding enzyme